MADTKKKRIEASTSGGGGNSVTIESVVVDVGRRKSTCGYCKSGARTSITHGLRAHSLTVDDYQALLDQGWRRSGCFLYKPEMEKTCCPSYTIRVKASDFTPSKEQIRVTKRMQRFLDCSLDVKKEKKSINEPNTSTESISNSNNHEMNDKSNQIIQLLSDQIDNTVRSCVKSGEFPPDSQFAKSSVKKVAPAKQKLQAETSESLLFSSSIAFQIAATLTRKTKNPENSKPSQRNDLSPNTVAQILVMRSNQFPKSHDLSIRACNGHINFYSTTPQPSITPTTKTVHVKKTRVELQGQKRNFQIRLKQSSFDPEEYSLYKKYQLRVHNDTPDHVTESSYKRFLVDSPLLHIPPSDDSSTPPCGFGSFHQQYILDGKLIAVGVIDILPKCLSSKYLFWDPDFAFLSLGKYSALEEIKWVKENEMHCPSLQHYYLGYYIHSCNKMRYKASYRPSELLCPLQYQWVPYEISKPFLDKRKYVVLSDIATLQYEDSSSPIIDNHMEEQQYDDFMQEATNDVFVNDDEMDEADSENSVDESYSESSGATTFDLDLNNVLIGLKGARLRYKNLRRAFDSPQRDFLERHLQRYIRVVGSELSEKMVYSLG